MADVDRSRGILTPADRRFLLGDVTLGSEQSRYDARYRIRQRTRDALLDFPLLFEQLADRDRKQVFDADSEEVADAIVDAIAFLYLGASTLGSDPERLLSAGIRRAERRKRGPDCPLLDVELSVAATDEERVDHIARCVGDGAVHDLDDRDLRVLARLLADREGLSLADILDGSSE